MKEMVGGCCVCSDERGWPDNPLVYCDGNGCTVAVHQACYGIVTVPTGPWFCRKCESPEKLTKVRCELCPSKSGALKRTDTGGWAHVVCALYIPEVRFGNVTSMEPIILQLIPQERFTKNCYICEESRKPSRASAGACMQCNKSGCKQQFHVTCAQGLGLLCEEAGNYLDNVKYCGYCQHHYSKLKKGGNVKTIPPYKPIIHDSQSSDSSAEKDAEESSATNTGSPRGSKGSKGSIGRKSSHSSNTASSKSAPSTAKLTPPTNTSSFSGKTSEKSSKKVASPSEGHRRSSQHQNEAASAAGSKPSTPAPSPHHTESSPNSQQNKSLIQSTSSSKIHANPRSASSEPVSVHSSPQDESVGVISSVSSSNSTTGIMSTPTTSQLHTSLTQSSTKYTGPTYQESVITNNEYNMENKQTKKRKAITQANIANAEFNAQNSQSTLQSSEQSNQQYSGGSMWDSNNTRMSETTNDATEIKKAKTETQPTSAASVGSISEQHQYTPATSMSVPYTSTSSHAQLTYTNSPRHLTSPNVMAGPSNAPSNIRPPSVSNNQTTKQEPPASLVVSVPLPPSTSQGLNLTANAQVSASSTAMPGPSNHSLYQLQRQGDPPSGHRPSSWHTVDPQPGTSYDHNPPPPPSSDKGLAHGFMPNSVRTKKRQAMAATLSQQNTNQSTMQSNMPQSTIQSPVSMIKRTPQMTPSPHASFTTETIKESPPSSPGEQQTPMPRKPAFRSERSSKGKSEKMMHRTGPQMLGTELNPESAAAIRLSEHLSAELAGMHPISPNTHIIPPPLINKATSSLNGRSSTSSGSQQSSSAQSLDQLLERQWEQGSQFLMEQAQHFDIASLLSCLHQLRTENVRLEEHVAALQQRRDHLLAVNARLAIPLTSVPTGPPEPPRPPRENGGQVRGGPGPVRGDAMSMDRAHQVFQIILATSR